MSLINAIARDLRQYGLTPNKIIARYSGDLPPPVLANSIPKSGTNLLTRFLYSIVKYRRVLSRTLTNHDDVATKCAALSCGQFMPAHLYFSPGNANILANLNILHIFMIRDPRDVVVSNVNYITRVDKKHRLHNYFARELTTDGQRLRASIRGISVAELGGGNPSLGIGEHLTQYVGWLQEASCLVVRFEDLIGPEGGGDRDRQLSCVSSICDFLGIETNLPGEHVSGLYSKSSRTFFKGVVGAWREAFTEEEVQLFKQHAGDALIQMGYESDQNW